MPPVATVECSKSRNSITAWGWDIWLCDVKFVGIISRRLIQRNLSTNGKARYCHKYQKNYQKIKELIFAQIAFIWQMLWHNELFQKNLYSHNTVHPIEQKTFAAQGSFLTSQFRKSLRLRNSQSQLITFCNIDGGRRSNSSFDLNVRPSSRLFTLLCKVRVLKVLQIQVYVPLSIKVKNVRLYV